jgi:4-hydroxy-3-polyprenylbenzoate decarboxylase
LQFPVIVGISGASGVIHGVELLRALKGLGVPAHLILSEAAVRNLHYETDIQPDEVRALASKVYQPDDIAAPPASGSFLHAGMVISPCSMKTLSAVANSYADNLLTRAADVCLKESRPLVLMVRETPLHQGHLENMLRAARLGAIILPPMPASTTAPQSVKDIVMQSVGKALDQLGIGHDLFKRWGS